jgi:hypothetical protein
MYYLCIGSLIAAGLLSILWLALFLIKKSVKTLDVEMEDLAKEEEPAESYYQFEQKPYMKVYKGR